MPMFNAQPTRRAMLAGLGASGALAAVQTLGMPPALAATASLGELAAQKGILFGASSAWEIIKDPAYAALHRQHSRLLVTDHALKFDFIRPSEAAFDYAEADALEGFAKTNGIPLRGHTLIWNDNPPRWLRQMNSREITRVFDAHIDTVGARFAGRLHSWDVVNEPFWPGHRVPGGFRRGPWFDAMGKPYIARAFKRLESVDRHSLFVLNEAQTERQDELGLTIRAGMLRLIDDLLDQGVKLDAVGLQAHIQPQHPFDSEAFLRFIDEIAARKLKIYLTEFDVDDASLSPDPARRDVEVAQWTSRFLEPVLQNTAVTVLVTWHLSDRYTWYRDPEVVAAMKRGFPARALPFDDAMQAKPMVQAIAQALARAPKR